MRIAVRADAGAIMGVGHVMRCLTLADALSDGGAQVLFVCRAHPGHLSDLVRERGHGVAQLREGHPLERDPYTWLGASPEQDAAETLEAVRRWTPDGLDWLVADHYAIDADWHVVVRQSARRIMAIDDLANRPLDADLLLDQNFGAERRPYTALLRPEATRLLGPAFALIAPSFGQAREAAASRPAPPAEQVSVLILLGGSDPDNLTGAILDLLPEQLQQVRHVDVVIGRSHPDPIGVQARCDRIEHARLHIDTPEMATLLRRADLAIGATGTSTWERMCVGVPTLALAIAPNQEEILHDLSEAGLVAAVEDVRTDPRALLHTFRQLLHDQAWRADLRRRGKIVVDGLGTRRVVAHMMAAEQPGV